MIAVTGATGYLGNVLIRLLDQKGENVKVLVRASSDQSRIRDVNITPVTGDILDQKSLEQAFHDVDTVYHCAAFISIAPGQEKQLYNINVKGTENVLTACTNCGVRRMVFVSTLEAMDWTQATEIINETAGFHPENACIEYGKSKAEASLLVLSAVEEGLDGVIAAPTGFIGPGDYRISSMTSMILDFALGRLPAYVGGGFDFVDVRDAAEGIIRAADRGRTGETYLLGGEYLPMPIFMKMLEELTGKKKPFFKIPFSLANLAARVSEKKVGTKKGGRMEPPKFTRDSLKVLQEGPQVDCGKAKKELDYSPRPALESLQDTLTWLKEEGFLS